MEGFFMATQKKIDTVQKLTDKVKKATSIIFADFRGLKHKQLEELRKAVKKADGEFVVTKNRLMKRALGNSQEAVSENLESSTATLFAYKDEVAPLSAMLAFFKTAALGTTKGGLLGDRVMSAQDVLALSKLPGRQQLLGNLVRQLNAPIQGLHYALNWNMNRLVWALNGIKEKKE